MRYRLLTYLYSSMHLAHSHGGTLARPLFFTDPADTGIRQVPKHCVGRLALGGLTAGGTPHICMTTFVAENSFT